MWAPLGGLFGLGHDFMSLVFLPGLDGTGISFEPIGALLPPDVVTTVIRYPNEKLSFEETVDCAARQFPRNEADIVVAESFSGPVAIELLGSGRIKAKGLVLASTFARSPRPMLLTIGRFMPFDFLLGFPIPRVLLNHILGGEEFMQALKPMWDRINATVPASVLAHRLRMVSTVDVKKRLSELPVACCYIQAIDDVMVPATALKDFSEAMPNLVVKRIRGPHFILQAQPVALVTIIDEFRRLIADIGK